MIKAIPTYYAGIWFRSRLEAKWAAFFDQLGLPWQYEPIDLAGYIPDFLVNVAGGQVLVEVKPAQKVIECQGHEAKIHRSGWSGLWVIVGIHFNVQHGFQLPMPANVEALWAAACNKTQWSPGQRSAVHHASPVPQVDVSCFTENQNVTPLMHAQQFPVVPTMFQ